MKKLFAVLLTLALVLGMGTLAFAADNGTITINNTISGETYSVYKMFKFTPVAGTDNGIYSYENDQWKAFVETGVGKDYLAFDAETGTIKWIGAAEDGVADATEVSALAKAAVAYAVDNGIVATATKNATGDTVEFTGLDLGYYAIDSSLGTVCGLTTTDSDFEMTEKNEKPDLIKKIVEGDNRVDTNNVNIGDTVTYEAIITIGVGVQNYIMHDKMSEGLTYTGIESVKYAGENVDAANYTVVTDPADDCTFEIKFEDSYTKDLAKGTEIIVTYTATLNENAKVGAEGNPNEAWLQYSNDNFSNHDTVITYTTSLTVEKVDGNDAPLAGAGFTLYKNVDGNWVPVGAEKVITTLADGDDAIYEWNGLEAGTYKLVETTVPAGYNKAADVEFTITCDMVDEVRTGTETADWSDNNADVAEEDEMFNATIVNRTGSLLPETGGIGTTIFYIVGILLMGAAAVILVSKKRMNGFA